VAHLLKLPLVPVLPLRLCAVPGPLYTVLMGYKESSVDVARQRFTRIVAAHFVHCLSQHGRCVTATLGAPVDLVLPVPSTARPGRGALESVRGLGPLAVHALGREARWTPGLLQRAEPYVGHMQPHVDAFTASDYGAIDGASIALLDDTYVSGARAQSAAASLRLAGARSVIIVPLGRIIRPDRLSSHVEYLEHVRSQARPNDRCCRCVRPQRAAAIG
jgi:hypothetical protein